MKKQILTSLATLVLMSGAALATTPNCERIGNSNNYRCTVPGNDVAFEVRNAVDVDAAAMAVANQLQNQSQGQGQDQEQSQSSENTNTNVNGGNSVNIEGDPAHTTSMNLGVGVNFSVPIASGVQTRNAIDTANWFIQNGDPCTAFKIMSKAPRVRNLRINFNCGDKG